MASRDVVIDVLAHIPVVAEALAEVQQELDQELTNLRIWSVSTYGVEVEDSPHASALRDQLAMLSEELEFCNATVVVPTVH